MIEDGLIDRDDRPALTYDESVLIVGKATSSQRWPESEWVNSGKF